MSKAQHTPGPWRIIAQISYGITLPIYKIFGKTEDGCDRYITEVGLISSEVVVEDLANARRIVACVNACEGIPTEALEQDFIGKISQVGGESIERNRDLLDVLVQAVEQAGFLVGGPTDHRAAEHGEPKWVCNARAVIAKARRGQ